PDGRVHEVAPEVHAVDVAEATHRVVRGALRPDPLVPDGQLVRAGDDGFTQEPWVARPGHDVAGHAREPLHGREAIVHRGQPDPDGLVQAGLGHAPVDVVAFLAALELTPEEGLTERVELLVLVLPEA